MDQNDALKGQKDELENEQTDVETTEQTAQPEASAEEQPGEALSTDEDQPEEPLPEAAVAEEPPDDELPVEQSSSEEQGTAQVEAEPGSVSMEALLEEQDLELDFPKQGEVRQGSIASISDNEILVSVGTKSEGVLSGRELEQIPEEERSQFEIGQQIPVYVLTPEDNYGNVVLSYIRAKEEQDWELVGQMLDMEQVVESTIVGYNKGGLIVPIGQLRGFVPASQVSLLRRMSTSGDTPEQRWGGMVDEPIVVRIIEVDRERRRLILSERLAIQETRESLKDRLLEELNQGDVRTGRVTSLADFGAFVNIEGADGLVHLSEISWDRIGHPNEVLEVGQEVEVKVISIDRDRKRIGLSIRQLQDDPWVQRVEHLREGILVEGTVTHLTKFGAFARIGEDLEGLIHVSELSEQRIAHPKEVVHEGDVVTLRIIKIDPERHRIGLSLRKVDSPAYADLDWKMALAEEVGRAQGGEEQQEERSIVIEGEGEQVEDETLEETVPAEAEEVEAELESAAEDELEIEVELAEEPESEPEAELEDAEPEEQAPEDAEEDLEDAPQADEDEPADEQEADPETEPEEEPDSN